MSEYLFLNIELLTFIIKMFRSIHKYLSEMVLQRELPNGARIIIAFSSDEISLFLIIFIAIELNRKPRAA